MHEILSRLGRDATNVGHHIGCKNPVLLSRRMKMNFRLAAGPPPRRTPEKCNFRFNGFQIDG